MSSMQFKYLVQSSWSLMIPSSAVMVCIQDGHIQNCHNMPKPNNSAHRMRGTLLVKQQLIGHHWLPFVCRYLDQHKH